MKKITTEYAGEFTETPLEDIIDFLFNMKEIAQNSEDFVRKVEFGVTDETSRIPDKDRETLTEWYFNQN